MIISNEQYQNAQRALAILVSKDSLSDQEANELEVIKADIEEFEAMTDE